MSGPYDNYGYPQDAGRPGAVPPPPGAAPPPPGPAMPPPPPPPQWGYREAEYATTSMVLGIIALASIVVLCGIGLPAAPFAWYFGNKALAEIDASGGQLRGRESARAGQVMGIIGTILLILGVVGLLFVIAAASSA